MMRVEIDLSEDFLSLISTTQQNVVRAAALMEEGNELLLEAKRLLLENARLLRKVASAQGTLHIADREEETEMGNDPRSVG